MAQQNVHYFPGHMSKALDKMRGFVKSVDLIVEVVDGRAPLSSRNPLLRELAGSKPILLLLSKSDYADPKITGAWIRFFETNGIPAVAGNLRKDRFVTLLSSAAEPLVKKKREKEARFGMIPQPIRVMIIGIPNVGKSTLFNAITNAGAESANYPFCTIEPNVGVITVPDERLTKLAEIVHPGRIVPATCEIVDIAGLVKGASKGEGLGNKFLGNIRETDAIIHVLRCFEDENITHVDGTIDPIRDKEIIDTELQLKDLETIEARYAKTQKIASTGNKDAKIEFQVLTAYREALLEGKNARTVSFDSKEEQDAAKNLFLLTSKPVLYVCNVDETAASTGNEWTKKVEELAKEEGAEAMIVAAKTEEDIADFDNYEDKQMFLEELGLEESGVNRLIKKAYALLNLQTFITAGEMEVKAWTYKKGWKAPQCAGVIHTDFEKGFIRAEVIKYDDYIQYGSEAAIKEAGKMGIEGKDYVVQDGDIMHFRFNV